MTDLVIGLKLFEVLVNSKVHSKSDNFTSLIGLRVLVVDFLRFRVRLV